MSKRIVHRRVCPVFLYKRKNGNIPFLKWYKKLDPVSRAQVFRRIERIEYYYNLGDSKIIRASLLTELRFKRGSGLRIYGISHGGGFLILTAGNKSSQKRDIQAAEKYIDDFLDNLFFEIFGEKK